ncbi:YbhB/YbcL family Raf kinase inhibitor-like protein [Companilactobacillus allii]|uniref:Phosphatidylethanolamine-binding protein n=1 Tax=Companilactobacillus allii TaxID=1847728 RepID=A0A1P8Q0B3_9LACO|nr:YbhB/YbcL family Raf kinase inhibitor-like protein [Companilactobacillus allii]APX71239.1 hypothetical protein BTM29_01140 [Companilactobacillus allii]USQ68320.1 YbhB/YbcL family Raf kinase inhibitor-like protein [Companilactobacillus allii]
MKITVPLINGLLPDKYGKFAPADDIKNGEPVVSFPFKLSDIPESTKSLALTFTDPDSIPVCGFEWIHWTMANISPDQLNIPENFSQTTHSAIQGKNSSASPLLGKPKSPFTTGYNGPKPPDTTHNYVLKVYALDTVLDIADDFWMNELLHKMENHIVDSTNLTLPSRA